MNPLQATTAMVQRGGRWSSRLLRPKGHLEPLPLGLLILVGTVPILMALSRLLAYPGMPLPPVPAIDGLQWFGTVLERSLTLAWVPPSERWTILYLLLLPTAVLLITVTRLTLGVRVLGLRAILIAVGFQEIGIVPSLALIGVVAATVVLLRPATRRIRLPLYARISVIACIVSIIMVGALFLGPWLRSDTVWSVAFFPVVILAMLAEGIAKTIDQDNAVTAVWRLAWTVALALVIALVSDAPPVRELALHFPELMVTELVAIVLVSEFLDLRLLEPWQAGFGRRRAQAGGRQPRIAVVRNRWNADIIGRLGVAAEVRQRTRSLQPLIDVLRECRYTVKVFEGDLSLLRALRDYLPPDPRTGAPGGLVLNLAGGIQGTGRFCHVPAMLEMAGVAYSGPDPIAQARISDRYLLLSLLRNAGLATPRFVLATSADDCATVDLAFPLAVRPRCEPEAAARVAADRQALVRAVAAVERETGQPALVETVTEGSDIRIGLIGNGPVDCLPLLQGGRAGRCPAPLDAATAEAVCAYARRVYAVAGCRDYARVDVRLTSLGQPVLKQIRWLGILSRKGSFVRAAQAAGYDYAALMQRIVETAWARYRETSDEASRSGAAQQPSPIEPEVVSAASGR